MLTLRRPSDAEISDFLRRSDGGAFSYSSVGGTQSTPPAGFNVDHHRIRLGAGEATFARASAAVRRFARDSLQAMMRA